MASGKFVHNSGGYKVVLNGHDAWQACDSAGAEMARVASVGTASYTHDTMRGQVRIHTRVKTVDYVSAAIERNSHRLARAARLMTTRRW